jgi:hypothetical protein
MKKLYLIVFLLITRSFVTVGQSVEVTPFGGYVFPYSWNGYNGSIYFDGNAQYGGIIGIATSRVVDFEFMYNRIDTKAEVDIYGAYHDQFNVSKNYYMIGGTKNFRVNETVSPYLGLKLGGVYMAPKETSYYSYWFFALGLDGGVKFYLNKVVGLRLQAQLLIPVQGGGFTFYYGSGGGGTSAYVTSTMLDFGFTGGLIFRLGK